MGSLVKDIALDEKVVENQRGMFKNSIKNGASIVKVVDISVNVKREKARRDSGVMNEVGFEREGVELLGFFVSV